MNSLFSRMTTQLEAAEGVGRNVTVAIVQLAAVLGIVKSLRLGIVDWLPKNDRLVDAVKARKFFTNVCRSLYGPTRDLAGRALVENNGQPFDELTSVRALLVWLALDSGVNAETLPRDLKDAPDSAGALVLGVACLLPVATECAQDSHAGALLVHTLAEQPSDAARAERHLTLGKTCPCGRVDFQDSGVRSIQTRRHRGALQSEVPETIRGVGSAAWQDRCPRPRSARPQALRGRLAGADRISAPRNKRRAT